MSVQGYLIIRLFLWGLIIKLHADDMKSPTGILMTFQINQKFWVTATEVSLDTHALHAHYK